MADINDYLPKENDDNEETQESTSQEVEQTSDQELEHALKEPEPMDSTPEEDDDLPEDLRGKSPAELAKIIKDQQAFEARRSNEVGELRKIVDEYIVAEANKSRAAESAPEPEEEIDYWTDPQAAIEQAIRNNPEIKSAQQAAAEIKRHQSVSELQKRHPDIQKVVSSQKFMEWVQQSPIRVQLYQNANQGYDLAAADELVTTFKAIHGAPKADKPAPDRQAEVKKVDTGSKRAAAADSSRKKKLSRAELIRKRVEDPEWYEAHADEILKAYQEKRLY